jgi:hypothetical protein
MKKASVVVPIVMAVLLLAIWILNGTTSRRTAPEDNSSPPTQANSEQKAVAKPQAPSPTVTAWGMLLQVIPRLVDPVAPSALGATFRDLTLVDFAAKALESENNRKRSPTTDRINKSLREVKEQIAAFHTEEDDSDKAAPQTVALGTIKSSCEQLEKLYEPSVLVQARELAQRYRCPMHPDVMGMEGTTCPKCGMPLETQVRLSPSDLTVTNAVFPKMVRAQVEIDTPLEVGVETKAHLSLSWPEGDPVTLDDLSEVHTRKIHLLIIDGSFIDYHHEHPVPTAQPGHYDFAFTPRKPGSYLAWADIQPNFTGIQEYAMTVIPAATQEEPLKTTKDVLETTVDGLHYTMQFQNPVKAGEVALGTLRVTQSNGSGFTRLEPVMGTFAHLVGFHENHITVLHIHPEVARTPAPGDHGGPDLHFRLFAPMPGFFRLFAQIQRDGFQQFAPFAVNVAPGNTPWIDQEPPHLH